MEKDTSFLFGGITFNRKRFASDLTRFQEKKEIDDVAEQTKMIDGGKSVIEAGVAVRADKRRKKKTAVSDPVEGFNVFGSSKSKTEDDAGDDIQDEISRQKKEYYRQLERDSLFRKSYNIHVSGSNIPSPFQNFTELRSRYNCKSYLLRNLTELGFKEPTPIQSQAIPVLLSGRECFACAPTGSGKTFAFICPILVQLKRASRDGTRAVILCPTRELAAQTARECKKLAKGKKFYIKLMTKQLAKSGDFSNLPCDIIISTPFRVQYAIRKRKLDLSKVAFLVLDESDKLFELGLIEQVDAVVKACSNPSIVRSLFSATLPDTVEELACSIMHDAVRVIIGRKNSASELIKQKLIFVGSEEGKLIALRQSFTESLNPPVLLFVQNKDRAKQLYSGLKYDNIRADVIHADLSQFQREQAIDNFRSGKTWVLIATDVISRGMDFKGVNCVINYDFPDSAAAYIHRIGHNNVHCFVRTNFHASSCILNYSWLLMENDCRSFLAHILVTSLHTLPGRTGRAGRRGEAITFYTESDVPFLRNIANVMTSSGCEVPEWIMSLHKKKWRRHRPQRDPISAKTEDEE